MTFVPTACLFRGREINIFYSSFLCELSWENPVCDVKMKNGTNPNAKPLGDSGRRLPNLSCRIVGDVTPRIYFAWQQRDEPHQRFLETTCDAQHIGVP